MQNTSLKNSQNVTREHWCPPGWLRQPSRPQLFIHSNLSPMTRATRHSMSSRPLPKNPNSNKYKTRWKTELLTTANFWARSPLTARGSADFQHSGSNSKIKEARVVPWGLNWSQGCLKMAKSLSPWIGPLLTHGVSLELHGQHVCSEHLVRLHCEDYKNLVKWYKDLHHQLLFKRVFRY